MAQHPTISKMETTQTAVEWLLEQIRINKLTFYKEGDNKIPITLTGKDIVEQAKQMEREQIKDAWDNAAINASYSHNPKSFEQYYTETYGK